MNNINFGPGFAQSSIGAGGGGSGSSISLRDQIAIAAMVAFIHNPDMASALSDDDNSFSISEQSYKIADAMLEERLK